MGTISNEMERKLLVQDLQREPDSDEDGGAKTRFEIDSDFSYDSEEEARLAKEEEEAQKAIDPERDWGKLLDKNRAKGNTGPKGVKADYEEATRIVRRQNETKALKAKEAFKTAVYGKQMQGESLSYNNTYKINKKNIMGTTVKSYDADSENEDEDAILLEFRQKRLAQMKSKAALPKFGRVIRVDKFEFLDHIDEADPRTVVVIHIFEDYIRACSRMNDILQRVASRQSHIKFLTLKATEASQTLSHKALPAFLVYKAGKLVNDSTVNVVKSYFDGDENFSDENVEWMLATKYGIELVGVDVDKSEQDFKGIQQKAEQEQEQENSETAKTKNLTTDGYVTFSTTRKKQLDKLNEGSDDDW